MLVLYSSLVALVSTCFAVLLYGVHGRAAQVFGRSIFQGVSANPGTERRIALTFDDGPSEQTRDVLDYLKQEGVTATFFLVGANVRRLPEIAHAVAADGHELGNHTETHVRLCPRLGWKMNLQGPRVIMRELALAQEAIVAATGVRPRLFRAPYGMRWFGLRRAQRLLGLTGVMWTVIGHDWEWTAKRIAAHVLAKAAPGGIICLHDGRDTRTHVDLREMLAALRQIVPELKRQGYTFETDHDLCLPPWAIPAKLSAADAIRLYAD